MAERLGTTLTLRRRRWIYALSAGAATALVVGLAYGAIINLSRTNQQAQGSAVSYSGTVSGLSYTSTVSTTTANPAPPASTGTALVPQVLVATANNVCASTCTAGDLALLVTYTFNTTMAGSIQITLQVSASSGGGTSTLYFQQPAVHVSGTIAMTWDLGTTASMLTKVTVTIHQCSGATCP